MTGSTPESPPSVRRPLSKGNGEDFMGGRTASDGDESLKTGFGLHSKIAGSVPIHRMTSASDPITRKAEEINLILLQPEVDLWRLRELALSEGGLVNDTLRKRAWPRLVGLDFNLEPIFPIEESRPVDTTETSGDAGGEPSTPPRGPASQRFEIDTTELKKTSVDILPNSLLVESMDAQQIERDVARCTWHLLTGSQRSRKVQYQNKQRSKKVSALLKKKQRRLANLINLTLVESYERRSVSERLRYYQGYHDVACIFMHALGGVASASTTGPSTPSSVDTTDYSGSDFELPAKVLQQVSFSHLSDALQSNFLQLQTGIKLVLFPLLAKLDPQLHNHLLDADMEPFFCLSWIITWFSHDVRDTQLVKRLFDAFIVSHPLLPIYMAISMMIHPYNRQRILETDCDFASLHQVLASLPKHSCRVGWKRRNRFDDGGLEYISDHEDECCGGQHEPFRIPAAPPQPGGGSRCDFTASTEELEFHSSTTGTASIVSGGDDTSSGQWIALDKNGMEKSPSMAGLRSNQAKSPVPFQEILDKALQHMKRYPPSCLVTLAQAYYQDDWSNQLAMLDMHSSGPLTSTVHIEQHIALLRPCRVFSITPFCSSEWVAKQRLCKTLGIKSYSRKNRRRKNKSASGSSMASDDNSISSSSIRTPDVLDPMEFVRRNPNHLAVIAVGLGPGLLPEIFAAKKKRHRRRILAGSVILGFAAMTGSFYFQGSEQDLFGTTSTHDIFGKFWSSTISARTDGPNFTGTNKTTEENAAMNAAASVILPRINVLQELPSPPHLKLRTKMEVRQLPKRAPASQNSDTASGTIIIGPRSQPKSTSFKSITSLPSMKRDNNSLLAVTQSNEKLTRFAKAIIHSFCRLFLKVIMNPIKVVWRVLSEEAKIYLQY